MMELGIHPIHLIQHVINPSSVILAFGFVSLVLQGQLYRTMLQVSIRAVQMLLAGTMVFIHRRLATL